MLEDVISVYGPDTAKFRFVASVQCNFDFNIAPRPGRPRAKNYTKQCLKPYHVKRVNANKTSWTEFPSASRAEPAQNSGQTRIDSQEGFAMFWWD